MEKIQELKDDLKEFEKLVSQATRENVKSAICLEIQKLQDKITNQESQLTGDGNSSSVDDSIVNKPSESIPKSASKITDYAWDQSEKFVKIYVTLKNVQSAAPDSIHLNCTERSVELIASNVENKSYSLTIKKLMDKINPTSSYHKIKTDMVILFLRKINTKTWSHVTEQDRKATEKRTPKVDDNDDGDPSSKLMGLLKQMYDDGDDEMKRTIAKSWTESRNKSGELDGMPEL